MALPQEANGELSYSLTSNYYTDPAIFAAERERIFFRTWQRVGHGSQATAPGDYFTCDVLGQELVVLRGEDGALRAFHNVCQHRAHRLLEGAGNVRVIACPYHAWTYKLDGALSYAPNSENVPGFDGAKICLAEVQLEMFCNFVFVNLDAQATPLAETVPGLEDEIRSYLPDCDDLVLAHRTEATYDANWKVAVENYSECYHCDLNHPTLMKGVLDAGGYRIELHERYQKHASAIQPDANRSYDFDRTRTPRGGEFGAWYLWPNCSFQAYPGGYLNIFKWNNI